MKDFTEKYGSGALLCVIILALALLFGFACLEAWCAMLLWNWVLVGCLAIAPDISFWPMLGLICLCSILFKSTNYSNKKEK